MAKINRDGDPEKENNVTQKGSNGNGGAGTDETGGVADKDGNTAKNGAKEPCKSDVPNEANMDSADAVDANPADTADTAGAELAAERDKYLRLAAEYDNYRKRSIKEREAIYSDAKADTILRMLPVYDNLERALKTECSDEAFYKGVEMTMTQLTEILGNMGAKPIPAVGEPFDPNRHNAVMTIVDPSFGDKTVAEEYQKGFMIGERVIRFSTVVVAN